MEWIERTASTNADLRERAEQGAPEGIVRIADYQTHGRGRRDRRWESPPEASLLVSLLLRPKCQPSEFSWLTHTAGLAVADLCEETTGAQARLKWPNDVVVDDLKLAGVLAEVVPEASMASERKLESGERGEKGKSLGSDESWNLAVVLGIGLNVSWPEAKSQQPGFNQVPISLKALAERVADGACHEGASRESTEGQESRESNAPVLPERAELLVKLLCNLERRYARVGQPDWSAELREEVKLRSATLGRRVSVAAILPAGDSPKVGQDEIRGVAVDITPSGSLLVVEDGSVLAVENIASEDAAHPQPARRVEMSAGDVVHLRSEAN